MAEAITREQYRAAYELGLQKHDGKIRLAEAVARLLGTGIDQTSGSILVGNVSYMLKGKVYKRAQSIPATEDYLRWIRSERGELAFTNALKALGEHVSYWESTHPGSQRRGLRELLMKYRATAATPRQTAILMEWLDAESAGYIDVFPLHLFAEEKSHGGVKIEVRGPRGRLYQAMCDIRVEGREAFLDFEPYPEFNEGQEMFLGICRISFEDADRTKIAKASWKAENSTSFKQVPVRQHEFEVAPVADYEPEGEAAEKKSRMVRDRPGQAGFRRTLKSVYGNRCCITDCQIPDVLDAAHIDGYRNASSDHLRNGLLLRSDIHALFDCLLISIDPATLKIHVASSVMGESGYAELHGKTLRLPKEVTHHPDRGALERHWKSFREKNTIS